MPTVSHQIRETLTLKITIKYYNTKSISNNNNNSISIIYSTSSSNTNQLKKPLRFILTMTATDNNI